MTASRLWTVFCNGCGQWENAGIDHTAKSARQGLRGRGWWLALPGGRDLCPNCVAKEEAAFHAG